jgi:N utilization substance protein B
MGTRRRAREIALQALFSMENSARTGDHLALFCRTRSVPPAIEPYFKDLVMGVWVNRDRLDALIEQFSSNWKVNRMGGVDRNMLRIAVFEMFCCADVPPVVAINEAIDISKKFGSDESGAFVNGILDSVHNALQQGVIRFECRPAGQWVSDPVPPPRPADPEPESTPFAKTRVKKGLVRRRQIKPI